MRQVCQMLLVAACATLLMPVALPAKAPKNPPPSRVDPNELKAQITKELMAQMKREIHKEVDGLRHEIKRAHATCFIQSEKASSVGDKDPIPFPSNYLTNSKITCQEGILILPSDGIYLVTYGVATKEAMAKYSFELQLSEMPLPGGRLSVVNNLQQAMGSLAILVTAKAGDRLQILNTSGNSAKIGADKKEAIAAFITVVQLH